jgi:hypothetical protein
MSLIKHRRDAASALQKLIFRAMQTGQIPRHEDCQAITDSITLAVIESFHEYMLLSNEAPQNEHATH